MAQTQLEALYARRSEFYFKPGAGFYGIFIVLLLSGLAGVGYFFTISPTRAWGSILLNNLFFFLLSFGGIILGSIQDVCGAHWGRPMKRLHEVFGLFIYVSSAVFIGFLVAITLDIAGAREVYKWIADPSMLDHFPGKNEWLTQRFFIIRVVAMLVVMALAVGWIRRQNTLADRSFLGGQLDEAQRLAGLARDRLRFWSAPLLLLLGVLFTFLMVDLTMSLAPLWFSTLWAGWLFAVLMQMLLATTLVMMFTLRRRSQRPGSSGGVGSLFERSHFHDVGKLLHGFSAFWAYLTYAHILTYWYGNIPEETEYFLHRLHDPWTAMMITVAVLCFVVPLFVLIAKPSKWTGYIAVPLSLSILFAQWLAHVVIVQPEVLKSGEKLGWPLVEGAGFLVFFALFMVIIALYGSRHIMVSLHDPLLKLKLDTSGH